MERRAIYSEVRK